MAKAIQRRLIGATEGMAAAGAFGMVGVFLAIALVAAVVAGLYERAQIEARLPAPASDVGGPDDQTEGFIPMRPGRHPSQPPGSAVIPAVPNDPWRQAHTRMQVAGSLREAASKVLDNHAAIRKAHQRDRYLSALFTSERTKASTSVVRRELTMILLLAIGGGIAVWGLQ